MDPTIILYNPNASASMIEAATNPAYLTAFMPIIVTSILLIFVAVLIGSATSKSKTGKYRETITDMYVAATIRKYADEDKLNLDEEYKKYSKWQKKKDLKDKELDYALESNLKDKVSEKSDREIAALK